MIFETGKLQLYIQKWGNQHLKTWATNGNVGELFNMFA